MSNVYKHTENYLFSDKVKVVGVDFDGTLTCFEKDECFKNPDGTYNFPDYSPNHKTISLVKRLKGKGKKVHIVTFRGDEYMPEVYKFCVDNNLEFDSVRNTSGEDKLKYLKEIKADCHIDDDLEVCTVLYTSDVTPILLVDSVNSKNITSIIFSYKL